MLLAVGAMLGAVYVSVMAGSVVAMSIPTIEDES